MSSFTTPLVYTRTGQVRQGRPVYRLDAGFIYHLDAPGTGFFVLVQAGALTDFASVPRLWRWLFPPQGPWAKAAVLHDWGYCGGSVLLPGGAEVRPSRFWWDVIFLEAMQVLKVPPLTRLIFFLAVRLFGGRAFRALPARTGF